MPCSMKSGLDCYSSFRERVYVWERDKDRVRQINKDRKGESVIETERETWLNMLARQLAKLNIELAT